MPRMTRMLRTTAYVREAFEAIWRNRTRSILTMLGMIIGTASIIGVLGISKAASGGIKGSIADFGDQGIFITVDANQDDPARAQIEYRDIPALAEATRDIVRFITPNYSAAYELRARGIAYTTTVQSQTDNYTDSLSLREGRRMNRDDVGQAGHVALLSQDLAERFFGKASALGERIKINGAPYRVIGVYDRLKSSFLNTGGGDYIEIPYTLFHRIKPGPVDFIQVYPKPGISVETASQAVIEQLQHIHGKRALYVTQDTGAVFGAFNTVIGVVAAALTAIGGVSLLVAGIGIMNIMLVSVTERTREIGLRKAVGASAGDITQQFLTESVLLSLMGGGIGTTIGFLAVLAAYAPIAKLVGPAPIPYLLIMSVAVGFSTMVGTVFGTYPAIRAGRLDPIEALRS
jgi:putative ABC transport system permease protein